MEPTDILWIILACAVTSTVVAQRLTTVTTGPDSARILVTLLRVAVVCCWVWFAFASDYRMIAVVILATSGLALAGVVAKAAK